MVVRLTIAAHRIERVIVKNGVYASIVWDSRINAIEAELMRHMVD